MAEQQLISVSLSVADPPLDGYDFLVSPQRRVRSQLILKRGLDILLALILILLCLPVLVMAALCIGISSPGPIFFRQARWGWREATFQCLKFRTMFLRNNLSPPSETDSSTATGVLFKPKHDARVTPVGAFLRKTSIDELPQLFNVLTGDMSLIGPRPLMLHMLEPFPEFRRIRCMVRPGITGMWQISARDRNTSALDMKPYDLAYLRRFSLWLDLKILLRTPAAVVSTRGAH